MATFVPCIPALPPCIPAAAMVPLLAGLQPSWQLPGNPGNCLLEQAHHTMCSRAVSLRGGRPHHRLLLSGFSGLWQGHLSVIMTEMGSEEML